MKKTNYMPSGLKAALIGYSRLPIDKSVFVKSPGEKETIKRLKKRANNAGNETAIVFSCDDKLLNKYGYR
jgi:hypothetical protein